MIWNDYNKLRIQKDSIYYNKKAVVVSVYEGGDIFEGDFPYIGVYFTPSFHSTNVSIRKKT